MENLLRVILLFGALFSLVSCFSPDEDPAKDTEVLDEPEDEQSDYIEMLPENIGGGFIQPDNYDDFPVYEPTTDDELPARFDWRDDGVVPSIRDQKDCGSCWAFGACSSAESVYAIQNGGELLDFSEQWLVSCNQEGWGCLGGYFALDYFVSKLGACGHVGPKLEEELSYQNTKPECACTSSHIEPLQDWAVISRPGFVASTETLKRAIKENGPIVVTVNADDTFSDYRKGIFTKEYASTSPNHVVVLTGWNDDEGKNGVWYLRNSWGNGWGENGTMRIEYGAIQVGLNAASFIMTPQTEYVDMLPDPNGGDLIVPDNFDDDPKYEPVTDDELPIRFDWRDEGVVASIRNQEECGSCWAFSTCATAESFYAIQNKDTDRALIDISEQWLVDCNVFGFSCVGGGWFGFHHFVDTPDASGLVGAVTENQYPYQAIDSSCTSSSMDRLEPVPDWALISFLGNVASHETLKRAIQENGPIAVSIFADVHFANYQKGVFRAPRSFNRGNHMVVLTGWDDEQGKEGIWFLRNSYGEGWGENGTMRIEYGALDVGVFAACLTNSRATDGADGGESDGADGGESDGADGGESDGDSEGDGSKGNGGGGADGDSSADGGESDGDSEGDGSKGNGSGGSDGGAEGNSSDDRVGPDGGSEGDGPNGNGGGGGPIEDWNPSEENRGLADDIEFFDEKLDYLDNLLDSKTEGVIKPTPRGAVVNEEDIKIDPSVITAKDYGILGVWVQTSGGNSADLGTGGYDKSHLLISRSGMLLFLRQYPTGLVETRLDWRISKSEIVIGESKEVQDSRMVKSITIGTVTISAPKVKLPYSATWTIQEDGRKKILLLDGKKYQRIK